MYVFCATLHDVKDVFNVENLWARARRGQKGQFLLEALEQHPRTQANRHQGKTYFSHVIVQVPKEKYLGDDDLNAGAGVHRLMADLCQCHQEKLGAYVANGEAIRYRVEPNPALAADEVRFRFGPAISLPAADEAPIYRIYQQTDSANQELGVIYPGQRLTLLNGDPDGSTFAVPGWPFGKEASLLLKLKAEAAQTRLEIAARPEHSLTITPEHSTHRQRFHISNAAGANLILVIAPYNAAPLDGPREEPTWTPGSALPGTQPRLRVVGVALQRLSSRAPAGLLAWRLAFDADGKLVRCNDPHTVARLRIDAEDRVWGEVGQAESALTPPSQWSPQEGLTLELIAAPEALQSDCCGWVRLPQPVILNAPVGWFCFGRSQDAELSPALFDDTDAWQWAKSQPSIKHPEQLLLSRRHVNLCADARGWKVKLASTTWPVYLLDAAGALRQTLSPPDNGEQAQEQAAELGTLLVVGGYILKLG